MSLDYHSFCVTLKRLRRPREEGDKKPTCPLKLAHRKEREEPSEDIVLVVRSSKTKTFLSIGHAFFKHIWGQKKA